MSGQSSSHFQSASEALPPGWSVRTAGEVAEIKLGKMLDRAKHTSGKSLPYLRNINVRWGNFKTDDLLEMFFDADEIERYSILPGDLVVCEGGEPGRAAIWREKRPAMFQKALHRVRPGPSVTAEWFLICLRFYGTSGKINDFVSGSTIKHLTRDAFTRLPIAIPPLPEQRRIVARLEALEERSRRARDKLAEVPAQLAQARQSLLAAAFRGDLTADWRKSNAATWDRIALGDLTQRGAFCSDGDWVESVDQDPQGSVRLIQLADIGEEGFRDKSSRFLTEEKAVELRCTKLEAGDLLIARMAEPLGRTCIFPGTEQSCVTVVDVCIFRVGPSGVINVWLAHILNAPQAREAMLAHASGTTRGRISRSKLLSIELPLPPLPEQHEIVRRLNAAFAKLDAAARAHAAAVAALDRLDQSILARAFSGGLVAQDAAPEPATATVSASVQAQTYLLRFIPALLREAGHPVSLDDLNRVVALRFLPTSELLPVIEQLGDTTARAHFAASPIAYEDGAFLAAMRLLHRTEAIAVATGRRGIQSLSLGTKPPPSTPAIDADARHLALILGRVPTESVRATFRRLQNVEVAEELLTTP